MAEPFRFCGFNKSFIAPKGMEELIKPLPVHSNGRENISCWKLMPEEIAHIVKTGEVWTSTASGDQFHPMLVSGFPLMRAFDPDTNEPTVYHSDGQHIVNDARFFALLHHGDQRYSADRPYRYHLEKVVAVLNDYGAEWPYLAAGWLHDVAEDCLQELSMQERLDMIVERFGPVVTELVWACTGQMHVDGVKQNRKARNAEQYAKIAAFPEAAVLKIADRIANMEAAIEDKWNRGGMYVDEYAEFDANVATLAPPAMRERLALAVENVRAYLQPNPA